MKSEPEVRWASVAERIPGIITHIHCDKYVHPSDTGVTDEDLRTATDCFW